MSINKVLYNIDQRGQTTDAEKKTARDNIGAVFRLLQWLFFRNDRRCAIVLIPNLFVDDF